MSMYGSLTIQSAQTQEDSPDVFVNTVQKQTLIVCNCKGLAGFNTTQAFLFFCLQLGGLAHSMLNELVNAPAGPFQWPLGV